MKKTAIFILFFIVMTLPIYASDYHVMTIKNDGSTNQINVVFHIPVPDETNSAGVSLRTVLSEHIGTSTYTSSYPLITTAELTQIQNGEIYELSKSVQVEDSATNIQKRNAIDSVFTNLSTSGLNKLRNILEWYGLDRNVP